jgi:DNA-directed RNA polymerase specialized sigma24 family protein
MARRALLAPLEALVGRTRPDGDAGVAYEHRQELALVLQAIRQLPRRDRDVLLLCAAGELRIPEIASVTGATPASVKMRLHRARRRLTALHPRRTDEHRRHAQ